MQFRTPNETKAIKIVKHFRLNHIAFVLDQFGKPSVEVGGNILEMEQFSLKELFYWQTELKYQLPRNTTFIDPT